jgi:hypothetical protein
MGNKNKYFAKAQEAERKDVERAFGVMQYRFAIVRGPAPLWDMKTLGLCHTDVNNKNNETTILS